MKVLLLSTLICACALAQAAPAAHEHQHEHNTHTMHSAPAPAADAPAHTTEYNAAMMGMHDDMMKGIKLQNPDAAFAAGMLPHHQGAVKMAEIELKYGTDKRLRELAQDIIRAQNAEIAFMKRWLEKHSAAPAAHH